MRTLPVLVLSAVLLVPQPLAAWGRAGHQIVANIAQARLSPAARRAVADLLKGATLASVSTEADNYGNSHPESFRWHFVDIPINAAHYNAARDCREVPGEGDCILAEIGRLVATLEDPRRPRDERAQALVFLVHFVGDLHCPPHSGDNHDRGGNDTPVTLFDNPTNLHAVWDSGLIRQLGLTVTAWTDLLEKSRLPVSAKGTPIEWAEEAHLVAKTFVYRVPADGILGQAYLDASVPALKLQLLRGGVRLAALLNAIFRQP